LAACGLARQQGCRSAGSGWSALGAGHDAVSAGLDANGHAVAVDGRGCQAARVGNPQTGGVANGQDDAVNRTSLGAQIVSAISGNYATNASIGWADS